jgi:putative salt-induced outer membrane protein YdiY
MFDVRFLRLLILLLTPFVALAQDMSPSPETSTNPPPVTVIITNDIPPAITNIPPTVKPKAAIVFSGATLMDAFSGTAGGKFSVSGRTLRLPQPGPAPRASVDWRRNLDFGMTLARGNSDILRYSLGLDAVMDKDLDLIRIRGKGTYGESEGIKDTENAMAGVRYERLLTERVYALGNIEWMSDSVAGLDYRITGILSPGLRLIRSATTVVNVELGAGYIEEKKDEGETGWMAGRAAATVEKLLNAHVLIWCTGEYLPKLSDPGIFFVNAEAGIASFITRGVSLNVCYQERYDSAPVEGKKGRDTVLYTALSVSF